MVGYNEQFESQESQSLQAELQSLYREVIQELEDFSRQDAEHGAILQEALQHLQDLNIEAAKNSLQNIELPEIVDQQLEALMRMQENLDIVHEQSNSEMPPKESTQEAKDAYVGQKAKREQQAISQQWTQTIKTDMANPDNYPKDILSRGIYAILQQISKRLRNTDI